MKKSLSKASLKNESQQPKTPLSSSNASQQRRLLTESSLFMIGSNTNSSNQQLTISNYSDSNQKINGLQLRISNSQISEDKQQRNDQNVNQNMKLLCSSNIIARADNQNNNTQNMNIPQLTFISASKTKVTQKKKNQGPPLINSNQIQKRTLSIEKLGQPKQQQQQQIQGVQFQDMVKRTSLGNIDTLSFTEKKKLEKLNTPNSYNTYSNTPSKYNSAQKRSSNYDLNQSRNRNNLEISSYLSTNCHNSCILPHSITQYPNQNQRDSSNSAKKNKKTEHGNSVVSNSPSKSRLPETSSKNSFISKSVGRTGPNNSAISNSQHSSNWNQQQNANQFQTNNPMFQQAISCYSSINIKDLINYEKYDSNDKFQNNDNKENKEKPQNSIKFLLNNDQFKSKDQVKQSEHIDKTNDKTENNTENNLQCSNIFEIDIDSLKSDLINKENKNSLEKEKNSGQQQLNDLLKENEQLKEICISLENENSKIRIIMTEQEEEIKKMKEIQPTSDTVQNKCNSCNQDITSLQNENSGKDDCKLLSSNQISEFDSNQLKLKNQEYSIRIKVLSENIKELEYKNKELQDDANNFVLQKAQLEQEVMKMHQNFMEQQKVIHELTINVQRIHNMYPDQINENIKKSKIKLIASNNPILIDNDQLETQSPKKIKSSSNLQNLPELSIKTSSIPLPIDMAYIQKSKMDSENQSLIYKIEDLESQLNQVYKSLNCSPQKQSSNNFNFNIQKERYENKIQLFNSNQLHQSTGQIYQSQLLGDQLISFELVKQQQIEIENLKNEIKNYKNQIILWQERYTNLEKVHQSLLIEKTSSSTVQINQIDINTDAANIEKLRDYVVILARQIEDMDLQIKDQNSEISILRMNIQQKVIELQELQLKLDSKETLSQMIKKRINELEEQIVASESQKGQLKVQVKQLEDLFNNQKLELQQVYKLLKTRNMDTDDIQKQNDEYFNQTRKQSITIQIYEQKIEDLVQKNQNLQNQLYEYIHQQVTTDSANNLLKLQKEMNQSIINSLIGNKFLGQSTTKLCNFDEITRNNKQQDLLSSMNHKLIEQEVYSQESVIYSNPNVAQVGRYSNENPTFGSQNNIKNNQSENQSSKDHHSSSQQYQQNHFSFQNKIYPIQINLNSQNLPLNHND